LDEVVTAFAVEDGEELQPDNMPSTDILLQVCAGLVVLNKHDNTLTLVHSFAYEVLHILLPKKETQIDIARTCLRYLLLKPLAEGPCISSTEMIKRLDSLAFLEYSSKFWGQHVVLGNCEKDLEMLIMKLFDNTQYRESTFQALQFRQEFTSTGVAEELFQSLPKNPYSLHLAAYWGLTYITSKILEAGAPSSPVDSHQWTPLHWACANDKVPVAELLIRSGANVNVQDIQGWSPLFWAAFVGSIAMVRLLLSNGANHLARSSLGWTALHWAISGGHTEIVKELLEHHSQSKSSEPVFHTMTMEEIESYAHATLPVDIAAAGRDANIFTMLIEHLQTPQDTVTDAKFNMIWARERFDVPVSLNPWRTMTKGELVNGRESIVPRFTGRYADSSEQWRSDPKKWKSALLLSAIRDQQLSSVELLVKTGADVDYQSALCIAACRQDPRYVQCLLDNGANPNIKNKYGRTALHEAVMNGFMETIGALLDGGADVDMPVARDSNYNMGYSDNYIGLSGYRFGLNDNGSTALIQACGFSQQKSSKRGPSNSELATQITRLLLSRGASTRLKDLSGRTALHYVVLRPHLPLVKLLTEAGCPVDAVDCNGSIPLHLLALHKEAALDIQELKDTVRLLLNGKCENEQTNIIEQPVRAIPATDGEPNSSGENKSVLYKVTVRKESAGRSTSLERLEGFDEGLTPLSMALQAGRWEMVQVLLELGATFPAELDLTPILNRAIESVEPSITSLLLHHGARPSPGVINTLVESFMAQTTDAKAPEEKHPSVDDLKIILRELVSADADINFCQNEETPMTLITKKGGSETVLNILLQAGADIYTSSLKTFDPVLTSALFGEAGDVACLLDYAVAHPKEDHWSNYLIGVSNEIDPIMRLCLCLQKAGAINRTNSDGRTLLHLASEQGNITLVTSLVSCGAKADISDSDEWLPIHCAGFAERTDVLKFLLEQSTESSGKMQEILNKQDTTSRKRTMLDVAIVNQNIDMASTLLDYGMKSQSGIDPNSIIRDWRKDVPMLGYAAENGYAGILSILLQHGADIEKGDKHGWRPLHLACYSGHTDIVKILMEAGADIHAATVAWNEPNVKPTQIYQLDPWTGQPLHLATMSGQADIVKLLLEKGVDIHASTGVDANTYHCPGHGPTALHLALDTGLFYGRRGQALDHGRLRIAQWLVERGSMVRDVIRGYSLQDILNFRDFPDLWDALVAGDKDEAST
jgi:ankyrin repeat protein